MDDDRTAARIVYDRTASDYAAFVGTEISEDIETAADIELLDDVIAATPSGGRLLDLGCGTARVAARAAGAGIDAVGMDLAPAMLTEARAAHPRVPLAAGALHQIPASDGSFAAVVLWYSIIATPPDGLGEVWREIGRVGHTSAPFVVAFQAGDGEADRREDAYGSGASFTLYRHSPDQVAAGLTAAGHDVERVVVRPADTVAHEHTPQGFVLGRLHDRRMR